MERIYLTTPIYYVNAEPHIGHLYTTALADMLRRFYRLCGVDARFQTGTDEHGEKIVQSAAKQGVTPQEFADRISGVFRSTWDAIGIEYDDFIRTTEPRHKRYVQQVLQQVYDAGDIYFDEYVGKYCVGCERYLTDTELVDGKCPDHQVEPKEIAESNYFFKMGKYQDRLLAHLHDHPDWIRPARFRNEVLSFLQQPLEDLCISRPKSRLTWGIELPFDDRFVTYVWFDALLNYVSGLVETSGGDNVFDTYWPVCNHLIAKDILKTHAIYWPTMLMSAGLPLFRRLDVHGYWLVGDSKMSKSLGNAILPRDFHEKFGIENLRYFLFKEMKFGADANFTYDLFIERYNSDLANGLGNLLSRTAQLSVRKFGAIPPEQPLTDAEAPIAAKCAALAENYFSLVDERQFAKAIEEVVELIALTDKYITVAEPWKLIKDDAQTDTLARVLRCGLETVRQACLFLYPTMPQTCKQILAYLGEDRPLDGSVPFADLVQYGGLRAGHRLEKPPHFFPRIDAKRLAELEKRQPAKKAAPAGGSQPAPPEDGTISFDDFAKVKLVVGRIVEAHDVEGADKLVRLLVDLGEEAPRQVFAGIKAAYPDVSSLVGTNVVVVANLAPRKMKFGVSEAMILAASGPEGLHVVAAPDARPGDEVR